MSTSRDILLLLTLPLILGSGHYPYFKDEETEARWDHWPAQINRAKYFRVPGNIQYHLIQWFSKRSPWTSSISTILSERHILGPHPDLGVGSPTICFHNRPSDCDACPCLRPAALVHPRMWQLREWRFKEMMQLFALVTESRLKPSTATLRSWIFLSV